MNKNQSVACILISFNPTATTLHKTIQTIAVNNVYIIVIDNGSINQSDIKKIVSDTKSAELILLDQNEGIATAQNRGIKIAIEKGYDLIWLSDQDTLYPSDFKTKMLSAVANMTQEEYERLAVLSPSFFNKTQNKMEQIINLAPTIKRSMPMPGLNKATHVISSGMLIPVGVFQQIGLKRDDFFIDWVDIEWCWRAVYKYNLNIFVNGDVIIEHSLGDEFKKFLGIKFTLRSPFRHYFMTRNAIYLALWSDLLPVMPRVEIIFRTLIRIVLFPLIAPDRKIEHLKAITKGFWDGLVNNLGPKH